MPEEIKTAETKVENTEVNSNADIDTTKETNEVEFTDNNPEVKPSQEETKTEEIKVDNTKEINSENARRRREAERQKELKAAREQAIIETLGGKNPFTNEDIKDSTDVEEYLTMKEIEAKGGDPLADFSKFQKAKAKEQIAQQAEDEKKAEWYTKDREDFATKHPEVNLNNLIQDKQFQLFASGKVGTLPMTEIYEGFVEIVSEYDKKSKQIAKQLLANQKASPGALSSPNANDSGFFTREQVQKMTQKEVSENYDKIRASMSKWKN